MLLPRRSYQCSKLEMLKLSLLIHRDIFRRDFLNSIDDVKFLGENPESSGSSANQKAMYPVWEIESFQSTAGIKLDI